MPRRLLWIYLVCAACNFLPTAINPQNRASIEQFTVKEGLSENVVHCLWQDAKGFLWIGTHEGLNRYDGYSFKKYLHNKNDSTSLPNGPSMRLYEDGKGNLLVESLLGTYKMNMATGKFQPTAINLQSFCARNLGYGIAITNVLIDHKWYPASDIEANTKTIPITPYQKSRLREPGWIYSVYDANKKLWKLDSDKLIVITENNNEQTILDGLSLQSKDAQLFSWLSSDPNGNIWLRIPDKLYCIDKESLQIKISIHQSQVSDLPFQNITSILLDKSGVCWMGSFYGLRKLNLNNQPFNHFIATGEQGKLGSNFILGLNIHSGDRLSVQHYFVDPFFSAVNLKTHEIKQVNIGNSPLERYLDEVLVRNIDHVNKKNWSAQLEKMSTISNERRMLRFMYADREGVIWHFYNDSRVSNLQDNRTVYTGGTSEAIYDDEKYLWIATTMKGLFRYDKFNGGITTYQSVNDDINSISSNYLLCITPDSIGNLWIGTRAGGLNYFDRKNEKFTRFSEADGLSSNTIYCMVEDNAHYLWMGTAKGLSCFDRVAGKFHNFYTSDGLMNTEFNRWSAVKDKNGTLYFGGMSGIDYFKPEEVLQSRTHPPVVQITAFKTGNQALPVAGGLELNHRQNFITVEFASMDFRNSSTSQYKYQLEGASHDWINAEYNHFATFAALPPGKYIFRVKAATQTGVWGAENSIAFTITAPWWQRTWFYMVCALLIGALLYGFYRFRIRQLRKLYFVRSKISQDLHDEVGATLTSISFLSEVASNQASAGDPKAGQTLNKIGEFSREMIGEMNDIVWAINPANDKFEKIAERIRNFAMPLLSAKNIQFNLETAGGLNDVTLNMQQRKNLYLIFKEALNNAAKYAECSTVTVNITRENNHIRLDIIDNGKGFIEKEIIPGNGLVNIRHRAKEIKADILIRSTLKDGTAVSLSMPITQNT